MFTFFGISLYVSLNSCLPWPSFPLTCNLCCLGYGIQKLYKNWRSLTGCTWDLGFSGIHLDLVKVSAKKKVSVFRIFVNLQPGWVYRYLFRICGTLRWILWRNFLKHQQSTVSLTSQVPPQKYQRDFGCWWLLLDFPLLSTWSTTLTANGKLPPLPPQSQPTPYLSLTFQLWPFAPWGLQHSPQLWPC